MSTQTDKVPSPRIPLFVEIQYKKNYARQSIIGTLRNISLTGAYLQFGSEQLSPSDKLTIEFNVSGRRRQIHASVIWTNENGGGIKFHPLNNRDVQIVDDLMYFANSKRNSKKSVLDSIFKQVA